MSEANRSLFEDAVDVPLWLDADRDTPLAARADRDRELARRIRADNDLARVRAWWTAQCPGPDLGARLDRGRRLVGGVLVAVGLFTGSGFAAAALRYDGSTPVNVVSAFAILVGVQSLMLLLTLLMLLPGRFGLAAVQRSLLSLDPAVFAAALYRRFNALPAGLERLFAWHRSRSAASSFARWQLLAWSQSAAVAFNVGLLATAFALVAVTDLAFGWSTTLDVRPEEVSTLAAVISAPWQSLLPAAVPDAALVEGSRFFRLEDAPPLTRSPEAYTGWWPFLLASIVLYGLVPRLVLRVVAAFRLDAASRRLLMEDPGVTALLDRMSAPSLHLSPGTPEPGAPSPTATTAPLEAGVGGSVAVLIWAGALASDAAVAAVERLLGGPPILPPLDAGGAARLEDDRRTIERAAAAAPRRVLVLTRAWEPPLLDLLDFLGALRSTLGPGPSIVVCPVAEPGTSVAPEQLETWRRTLGRIGDPHLYVEADLAKDGAAPPGRAS